MNAANGRATNDDPAPGRSPGPPGIFQKVYLINMTKTPAPYSTNESDILALDVPMQQSSDNSDRQQESSDVEENIASIQSHVNVQNDNENYLINDAANGTVFMSVQLNSKNVAMTGLPTTQASFSPMEPATITESPPHTSGNAFTVSKM